MVSNSREFVKSTHEFGNFITDLVLEDVNFIRHFLDVLLVLLDFGLQGLVASGGHLGIWCSWDGEWVHLKKDYK